MKNPLNFLFALAALFSSNIILGQSYQIVTPEQAVAFLIGNNNVQVSNITFTGDTAQLGIMSNLNPSPFAISNGVLLSTDHILNLDPLNVLFNTLTNPIANDPDLLTVANSVPPLINQTFTVADVNDIAELEFDFVASGDTLRFNYIFGSNEYLTYVNTQYNDVFSFFISGPGISGPYASPAAFPNGAENIAFVPGSDPILPITISSVNNVLNTEFYEDSTLASLSNITLNGFTTRLVAERALVCGETYHIKLAIGDGSDQALASIVCLEQGSFDFAGGVRIEPLAVAPNTGLPENSLLEGCVNGVLKIITPGAFVSQEVSIALGGNATLNQDFSFDGPTTIFLNPQDTVSITISAAYDGIDESNEDIFLYFIYTDNCQNLDTASIELRILDYLRPTITQSDIVLCPEENTEIVPQIVGGRLPFEFNWSTGATTPTITVGNADAGQFAVSIIDFCEQTAIDSFMVSNTLPFTVIDSILICVGDVTVPLVSGGSQPYVFSFDTLLLQLREPAQFEALTTGLGFINVTDQCNQIGDIYYINQVCETFIPNIVSRDANGRNDTFIIRGIENFPNSQLRVWNRWGSLVYESQSYQNLWKGEEQPDGSYWYELKRSDGKTFSGYITLFSKE